MTDQNDADAAAATTVPLCPFRPALTFAVAVRLFNLSLYPVSPLPLDGGARGANHRTHSTRISPRSNGAKIKSHPVPVRIQSVSRPRPTVSVEISCCQIILFFRNPKHENDKTRLHFPRLFFLIVQCIYLI